MSNGDIIFSLVMLLLSLLAGRLFYLDNKDNKAIAERQKAQEEALRMKYKYYYGEVANGVRNGYFWKNEENSCQLLKDIHRKHEMILNSQVITIVKDEVNTLLNGHLFNLEKEILPILRSDTGNLKPANKNGLTYKQIFINHLQDISNYLDTIVNKQLDSNTLLNFNINNFTQSNILATSASLIEPLQDKGRLLLENLPTESEGYLVVRKLVNEYLPQVAIDYQLSLNQPLSNIDRQPKQIFDDITQTVDRYFDDIKSGQNVATLQYQQDHYSNLLVFERYLKAREIT